MIRILAKSVLASAALLAAFGAQAQPNGAYIATPAETPTKTVLMTRDTAWQLRDGAYVATNAPMREMAACQLVARSTGALSGFSANGQSFDAAALDTCNAKAKGGKAVAAKASANAAPAN
ncbi:hypothetical protein [Sphingomonas sp.]|jgi:hypothetical protein|uniref:CC_3452 family protein n=1 Tax=Sphingomonas sp. TaxID=28214 RepID=UPI00261AFFC7|nr:hypothetical protein [Sphingomonas sp.]MDF2494418.1 hypothetical protein [Sphingomonas sp.]